MTKREPHPMTAAGVRLTLARLLEIDHERVTLDSISEPGVFDIAIQGLTARENGLLGLVGASAFPLGVEIRAHP